MLQLFIIVLVTATVAITTAAPSASTPLMLLLFLFCNVVFFVLKAITGTCKPLVYADYLSRLSVSITITHNIMSEYMHHMIARRPNSNNNNDFNNVLSSLSATTSPSPFHYAPYSYEGPSEGVVGRVYDLGSDVTGTVAMVMTNTLAFPRWEYVEVNVPNKNFNLKRVLVLDRFVVVVILFNIVVLLLLHC